MVFTSIQLWSPPAPRQVVLVAAANAGAAAASASLRLGLAVDSDGAAPPCPGGWPRALAVFRCTSVLLCGRAGRLAAQERRFRQIEHVYLQCQSNLVWNTGCTKENTNALLDHSAGAGVDLDAEGKIHRVDPKFAS